jgi:protein TonB
MALRLATIAGLAALITFALFWAMKTLIGVSGELQEGRASPSIEFVRLKRDRPPEMKKRAPPKREKPEQPPPPPQMNMAENMKPGEAIAAIDPVDANLEFEDATTLGAGSDRDVVPLVQVEPQYPPRARQRGIEGWVELRFTITAAGTVKDPVVTNSHPGTIFNQAALQAIQKWKFTPKIENGVAVAREGARWRLRFGFDE